MLVVTLLVSLSMFALPNLMRQIERERLPTSARQMRALLTLVRANAMFDGKRYRIRFPIDDETDSEGEDRQPLIERENDPLEEPGVFSPVTDPWTQGATLLRDIWCAEVRLGRPTIEELEKRFIEEEIAEFMDAAQGDFEKDYPPLYVEPDGTSEWATFLITDGPRDTDPDELEEFGRVEVILDGLTGLIWLQRPFYEEELEMLKENGWPPVLRKDFFRPQPLTEMDVLEISETAVRR